ISLLMPIVTFITMLGGGAAAYWMAVRGRSSLHFAPTLSSALIFSCTSEQFSLSGGLPATENSAQSWLWLAIGPLTANASEGISLCTPLAQPRSKLLQVSSVICALMVSIAMVGPCASWACAHRDAQSAK